MGSTLSYNKFLNSNFNFNSNFNSNLNSNSLKSNKMSDTEYENELNQQFDHKLNLKKKYKNLLFLKSREGRKLILNAFTKSGSVSVVEAETGSGKTIGSAYLLTLLLNYMRNKEVLTEELASILKGLKDTSCIQDLANIKGDEELRFVFHSFPLVASVLNSVDFLKQLYPDAKLGYSCAGTSHYNMKDHNYVLATTQHVINKLIQFIDAGLFHMLNQMMIIIDEVHVPSVENYVLLCLTKWIKANLAPNMRIVVMSATLGSDTLLEGFGDPDSFNRVSVEGRSYPIKTVYANGLEDKKDQQKECLKIVEKHLSSKDPIKGILIFVSGKEDIERLTQMFDHLTDRIQIIPFHGGLPQDELKKAFGPYEEGKTFVIISTDAAESSVTISDVDTVIDFGKHNIIQELPTQGKKVCEVLVSQGAANQRKGRCGRCKKGICYRLYSKFVFDCMMTPIDLFRFEGSVVYTQIINFLNNKLPAHEILKIDDESYGFYINTLVKKQIVEKCVEKGNKQMFQVTDLGRRVNMFPVSMENAVVLAKMVGSKCNLTKLNMILIIAALEGFQGNLPFWVPQNSRRGSKYNDYMQEFFEEFRGKDDVETYLNIFYDLFNFMNSDENNQKSQYAAIMNWSKNRSMNSKFIKAAVKIFKDLVKIVYPQISQKLWEFAEKATSDPDLTTIRCVLVSEHSDKLYKSTGAKNEYSCRNKIDWKIDAFRSFSDMIFKNNNMILALNRITVNSGKRFISFLVLIPN